MIHEFGIPEKDINYIFDSFFSCGQSRIQAARLSYNIISLHFVRNKVYLL